MDILNISNKVFIKLISICLLIAIVTGGLFYMTKGGFFDGILLTFVGLSCTYMLLVLSVFVFKNLTNLLVKGNIKTYQVALALIVTLAICVSLFIMLFKAISKAF